MKAISMFTLLLFLIFPQLALGAEGDDLEEPQPEEVQSVLTLTFGAYTKEAYTPLGLKLVLEEHRGAIQQTLQVHFGLDAIRIVCISSGMESGASDPFSIRFRFFSNATAAATRESELALGLQAALLPAGPPFILVETAAVAWNAPLDAGDEQEQDGLGAEGVSAEGDTIEEPRPELQPEEVELVLTLSFGAYTKAAYTPLGLKLVLKEHQGVIQQSLKAHFGLDALRMVGVSSGVAHHDLQSDAADPFSMQIRFFSMGAANATSERELARVLEAALLPAGPPFILVETAAVAWGAPLDASDEQEQDAEGDKVDEPRPEEVESVLTLTFGDDTKGAYTPLGLKLALEEHQGLIQQTLQSHFGLDALRIVSISSGVARRRLQSDAPDPFSMRIRFFSTGAATARSDHELARVLEAALSNAGAHLELISHGNSTFFLSKPIAVETVVVEWGALQAFKTTESPHENTEDSWLLVIGGLVAAALSGAGLSFLGVWACKKCGQRKDVDKHQEAQGKGAPADLENAVDDAKTAEELEAESASTQSPSDGASDDISSLGEFEGTLHPVVVNEESFATPV